MTELAELRAFLSTNVARSGSSYYLKSHFMRLEGVLSLEAARGNPADNVLESVRSVKDDLRALLTVLVRAEWHGASRETLGQFYWGEFLGLDLRLFHVVARTIMDRVAGIVGFMSKKPGQTPTSFNKLLNWLARNGNRERLDGDLAAFALSCSWFTDLRAVRVSLVHKGGVPLVVEVDGKPRFQVYEGTMGQVWNLPEHTVETDLVDMHAYLAITLTRLLAYLDRLAPLVQQRFPSAIMTMAGLEHHKGYEVLGRWLPRENAGGETADVAAPR